jgi:hypothetical protein
VNEWALDSWGKLCEICIRSGDDGANPAEMGNNKRKFQSPS